MFWKKKKEEKQKEKLVKVLNSAVDDAIAALNEHALSINKKLLSCTYFEWLIVSLEGLKINEQNFWWHPDSYTIEEIDERYNKVFTRAQDYKEKINAYWEKVLANITEMEIQCETGLPLFITMESLINPERKIYAMCYEFKPYEGFEYEYKAYVFTNKCAEGYTSYISPFDYKISKMTEIEFENHYIIDRCNLHKATDENEGIEYNNSLRRLFNGQGNK